MNTSAVFARRQRAYAIPIIRESEQSTKINFCKGSKRKRVQHPALTSCRMLCLDKWFNRHTRPGHPSFSMCYDWRTQLQSTILAASIVLRAP